MKATRIKELDFIIKEIVERESDELVIFEIVSWIEENIEKFKVQKVKSESKRSKDTLVKFHRIWIYSHHIYSNEKRRNMAQMTGELGLTGFVLAGKPGIICVEGEAQKVHEFFSQIKRFNFQVFTREALIVRKVFVNNLNDWRNYYLK